MSDRQVWSGAKVYEEKVLNYLASCLPKEYILINNRRLKGKQKFREFDLILLGKYAVYIVEIKHVLGKVIRGNNKVWKWDSYIDKSGEYEIESPFRQLWDQEMLLEGKFSESGLKVAVVECVCIISEERPEIQIDDVIENKEKIFWYKDLEAFLTHFERIPGHLRKKYGINEKTDIAHNYKRLKQLIDSNFTIRDLEKIGQYEIENEAWRTSSHIAYYAHPVEKTVPFKRVLLKLYKLSPAPTSQANITNSKKEINDFVTRLTGRANAASSMLGHSGDPATGGAKYIFAGQKAFPVQDDSYAVVSDWIDGYPLSYFLKDPPSSKYLSTIAAQICRGLAFIHSAKVFHRNLSTDNVIWSPSDREIRITNFHFARLIGKKTILLNERIVDSFIDETKAMPKYQAPELQSANPLQQIQPEKLYHDANETTDTYSLGVILLELFTGLFAEKDTIDGRLKELGHLNDGVKNIIQTYCSTTPQDRTRINLLDAAQTFEKLAGNVLPNQDLFNLESGTSLGFYEIIETLETTDLSVVYLARYVLSPNNQKVVIKVHKTTSRGKTIRKELWDAIQIIGEIDNQFTARLLQTEKAYLSGGKVLLQPVAGAQEAYYQIWEYIQGKDLEEYLESLKPYSLENAQIEQLQERFSIARGVLKALAALHKKSWTHRDIKPKNFMRTPEGQIKIIDFGLSKRSGDAEIVLGGTPCYIPPEAYSSNEWAEPGDVWAAGCLVTYILTGEEICASNNASQEIEKIKGITDKLGANIIQVFNKAVQNSPQNRYPSAVEFSENFEEVYNSWQNNEIPITQATEKTYRTEKLEEESNMKVDYNNILVKLKKEREDADSSGDLGAVDAINKDIRALEKWLVDGQKGDCPVDLSIYGITPANLVAPSITEAVETPKVEGSKNGMPETVDIESIAVEEVDHVQENLRRELERVRQHITNKEWREAVALARQVEGLAKGEVKGTASDLLSQVQVQLNKELQKVLAKGDAARAKNNDEKAREHYKSALDLDEENNHARFALQELDGLVKTKVTAELLNTLRAGLKASKDIRLLGEAVYNAESLDGEGKLPSQLVEILREARQRYDWLRQQHGEETTQMRFGDLTAKAIAHHKIQARVAVGERFIYNATTDKKQPAFDLLKEANDQLQESSEDTAQFIINLIEKNRNRPRYVYERISKQLEPIYYDVEKRDDKGNILYKKDDKGNIIYKDGEPVPEIEHVGPISTLVDKEKKILEGKLDDIASDVERLGKSEDILLQANQETDPVGRFSLLLQATDIFKHTLGVEEQIARVRPVALSVTKNNVEDMLKHAELFIRSQEYSEARTAASNAETLSAKWPEANVPEEITKLSEEIRTLRSRIDSAENAWKEYTLLASDIRKKVVDQNQRAAGLALFKQVSEDVRYQGFPDLRVLISEIDQYKGAGEQLNDANTARDKGDWSRVFEIADKALKSGAAGQLASRFQELHADAVTELNILRAQELLESDEIPEANNILSATLNRERERSSERENILRNRLSRELELVQHAIRGNKPMQELYDAACDSLNLRDSVPFKALTSPSFALRQSRVGADGEVSSPEMRALINKLKGSPKEADLTPQELTERVAKVLLTEVNRKGMDERLKALRLFRYVGGDKTQSPQDGWAPYALSLRTAEARRATRLLSESLRVDIFQPLVQQYSDYQGKENELKDENLHKMAEQAEALREAYLLETENERAVGRWVEVEWGKRLAHQEEKRSNWQRAVSIWKGLDNHHPGVVAVKRGLQNARIQDTINRAYYMVRNDHKGRDALALLKNLQAEPDMSNSWELNLALAETYETLGEFDSAFGNLDQIERVIGGLDAEKQKEIRAQVGRNRAALESQQVVYTCIADAKNKMTAGYPIEALRVVIQEGIENPKVTDPTSLQDLRDDIFNQASQELLSKTKIEQDKGTGEGKIQAVIALVDLQTLEDLIGQPIAKRRSTTGLNRLRNDLASVASTVILAAGDFDPTTMPLTQAISTASAISAQLQTFDNVTNVFNAELEPVREKLTRSRRNIASTLSNLQTLEKTLKDAENQSLWESAILTGDFEILKQYLVRINKLDLNEMPEVRVFDKRLSETQEAYHCLLNVIGQIRRKFSVEEDFGFVKDEIVKNKVQPPYRENTQAWQIIHAKEYEYIRSLLDDRVRVPDVYGRNDLVGWQKVLEQAEEREKELELWQEWERKCYQNMDSAERAVKVTETQPVDMPTRNKKMDWEKVLETAQLAISTLTYPQVEKFTDLSDAQEKTRTTLVVGVRDFRDVPVPIRSKAVKNLEEDGKRRKSIADQWVRTAQTQIEALQAILDQRGFPSAEEFNAAVKQSDWDRLEKLLVRAREAGITNENERKQVDTFARVLQQKRQEQQKKGFKLW